MNWFYMTQTSEMVAQINKKEHRELILYDSDLRNGGPDQ